MPQVAHSEKVKYFRRLRPPDPAPDRACVAPSRLGLARSGTESARTLPSQTTQGSTASETGDSPDSGLGVFAHAAGGAPDQIRRGRSACVTQVLRAQAC